MTPASFLPRLTRGLLQGEQTHLTRVSQYAKKHLYDQLRRSGENYATHGFEVALALRELSEDASLLSVAILHDILVHPEGDELLAHAPLTQEEKTVIREMHELRRLHIDASTHDLDRVIDAFTHDPKLLPLRMAHRLNDMRHLERFPKKLQKEIANETLHMYTAIAGRLGMHAWRYEMEEISFWLLQPKIAGGLQTKLKESEALDLSCLRHAQKFVQTKLKERGMTAVIDFRIKGLYSMYRKMVIKRRGYHELMDRLALRILVPTQDDCYRTLGVVHEVLHPVPGKLKDYIGMPKENGYRSIHTVVYPFPGVTLQPMEIQIRTEAMHQECEYGVAKHGEYKNYIYALESRPSRVNLFRNLESLREEATSPAKFEATLRTYFREDRVGLFDGKNNMYHLKKPVHAMDFLCHVHGPRIRFCKSVLVNGRERRLSTPLHDGDTVEARFGRETQVRKDWLAACQHAHSRKLLRGLLSA